MVGCCFIFVLLFLFFSVVFFTVFFIVYFAMFYVIFYMIAVASAPVDHFKRLVNIPNSYTFAKFQEVILDPLPIVRANNVCLWHLIRDWESSDKYVTT